MAESRPPRFSIVLAHDDRLFSDAVLLRALHSIAAQTCDDYEVLLYHDGPPTRPLPALGILGSRALVARASRAHVGDHLNALRQQAIHDARGEYVVQLFPDSVLYPTALAELDAAARAPVPEAPDPRQREGTDILVFAILMRGAATNGRIPPWREPNEPSGCVIFAGHPPVHGWIHCMQVVVRRELWLATGGWSEHGPAADVELYRKLIEEHHARYLPAILGEQGWGDAPLLPPRASRPLGPPAPRGAAPRFSIVVPHYDGVISDELLLRGLRALDAQTCRDFEILLYHDGPLSRPLPELGFLGERLASVTITERRHNDWGHSLRDRGIREARGDYIVHFNPDNVIYPEALEALDLASRAPVMPRHDERMRDNPDVLVFAIQMRGVQTNGRTGPMRDRAAPERCTIFTGLPPILCAIDCLQVVIRRSVWLELGGWQDKAADSDGRIYRTLIAERGARYLPEILGEHW